MIVYTVQKGDTLWQIARRYHIGLDALLSANPQISDPNYIVIGQQINVPELWQPPGPDDDDTDHRHGCDCREDPEARPCIYTAQEGETMEMIGQTFMVPLSRLLYFNLRFTKNEPLAAGERIIIPEAQILPAYAATHHKRR